MSEPLSRYHAIVKGTSSPAYQLTRTVVAVFSRRWGEKKLWAEHEAGLARLQASRRAGELGGGVDRPRQSLLDLKVELAERLMRSCRFCERRCGADRSGGKAGKCGVLEARIASDFLHMGEEAPLVPSYTVFFAGCNMSCCFCQNYDISTNPGAGREIPPEIMARRIENTTDVGRAGFHISMVREWGERAKNVNWVGGEPTPNIGYVLRVLRETRTNVPQIWNSNMYMSEEAMSLLDGVVDLYLADFKYGNDGCAARLGRIDDYVRVVTRNHLLAASQADLIVRHLVLPGHVDCCTLPVLEWLAKNVPAALVNIMDQYRPAHRASEYPELVRGITGKEYEQAIEAAQKLGLHLV
jgi:putative pyruvate formate lyase activating enzyme